MDIRLKLDEIHILKSEFLGIYAEACPRAMTDKNIKSRFRQAGLVPFNPGSALRRLPIPDINPPDPTVPLHLQTPWKLENWQRVKEMVAPGNGTLSRVARKACKAGQILQVENTILQTELAEQKAYNKKKDAKCAQK